MISQGFASMFNAWLLAQNDSTLRGYLIVAAAGAVALVVAALLRVQRASRICGPRRLEPPSPVSAMWVVLTTGMLASIMIPSTYASLISERTSATTQSNQVYTPQQIVTFGVLSACSVIASVLVAGHLIRPNPLRRLGFDVSSLPAGFLAALVACVVVLPLMFIATLLTQWVWQQIGMEHPTAHQLLRVMSDEAGQTVWGLAILSATVLAPLAEELLFRGCMQTAIVYTIDQQARIAARWFGILATSVIFTLFHQELWMMPPIFFLSVCLGYAYERTANLWAPILIHAAFNTGNVLLFHLRLDH